MEQGGGAASQGARHQGCERRLPGKLPEQKGEETSEFTWIWTLLVVLYPKIPLVSPGDAIHEKAAILRGTPSTRVCEQLIPTRVWGEKSPPRGHPQGVPKFLPNYL